MYKPTKYILLNTILIGSFLITACGGDDTQVIATAVAQTVAAQNAGQINTETPSASATLVTQTPLQFSPTGTPSAPTILPTRTFNPTASECAQAEYVSETIPDGTIFKPGLQFTKTWEIKNTSNCSWSTSYKIVFWDGDVLGGAYVYNLPQAVDPGQTVPISLVFIAPTAEGTYTSKWMLQTPDSVEFGVGEYSVPFSAEIVVSSANNPKTDITSVEFSVVRDPATGCPANVNHIVYATFTSNGPIEFLYYWVQSDGNDSSPKLIKMKEAGTLTFSREWKLHLGSNTGTKWMSIVILEPVYHEYPRAEFTYLCGS